MADTRGTGPAPTYTRRDVVAPLRVFLRTESGSAGVLVLAIVAALVWANVDAGSYETVWRTTLSLRLGDHGVTRDLRTWVNSGLMTFFFLVVGLEARREIDLGDLRDRRRLVLPFVAGALGMLLPALDLPRGQRGRRGLRAAGAWRCRPTPRSPSAGWPCSAGGCRTGPGSSCSPCSWSTTWPR